MTGFGDARAQNERLSVCVEMRSVNNRHLKVTVRCPEAYLSLENDVEKLVREQVARGTLSVSLRIDRLDGQSAYAINRGTLRQFSLQVKELANEFHLPPPSDLSALLALPGVIVESDSSLVEEADWPVVQAAVSAALQKLNEFRAREGQATATELRQLCAAVDDGVVYVSGRAPRVVQDYRVRLQERLNELLRDSGVSVSDNDLIREVGVFAERCDIHEELSRLRCHVEQFRRLLDAPESAGRKLEFLCQEMFREVNTIGSKANDVEIAHRVVDMKAAVERIREIVQNVE
jgi:uncharacterized protein (TIGR00255 family)